MTDEERLAVIEARAMGETPIEGQWNYGGVGSRVDYMVIPDHWKDDVVWLIARIRFLTARLSKEKDTRLIQAGMLRELLISNQRLEAQAALDAAVVEAASLVLKDIENEELDWDNTKQLDAALAAREEATDGLCDWRPDRV